MSFVAYWSRARLRATWRSSLALVLLVGLSGGTVLALVVGGLRTDSAYPRFLAEAKAPDALAWQGLLPAQDLATFAKLRRLPQVEASGIYESFDTVDGTTLGAGLGGMQHTLWISRLLAGRAPTEPGEAAVDWTIAQSRHLRVGDRTTFQALTGTTPEGAVVVTPVTVRVSGIEVNPVSFPPYSASNGPSVFVTPAFLDQLGQPTPGFVVRLHGGAAALPAFSRAATSVAGNAPIIAQSANSELWATESAIHPAAVALWILAGSLALVTVLILFQLLGRLSALEEDGYTIAAALGTSRRQLLGTELARAVAVAVAAAAVALVTAVALSPVFPLGMARVAEPDPGVSVNGVVLGVGVLLLVLLTVALALWPAWRAARNAARSRSWHAGRAVAEAGTGTAWAPRWLWLRPVAWMGTVQGLRPGRRTSAVPVRASITSLVVAVTGLTAALTFGANLDHLLDTPELYGWSWSAHVYDNGGTGTDAIDPALQGDPWLSAAAAADVGVPFLLDGHPVSGTAIQQDKGTVRLVIPSGRQPTAAGEVALGQTTLDQLHLRIGDHVRLAVAAVQGPTRTFTVVGTFLTPWTSNDTSLSTGVLITGGGFTQLIPPSSTDGVPPPSDAFVDFAPGTSVAADTAALEHQLGPEYSVSLAQPPSDLLNFGRVQNLPLLLALLLAALAAATLVLTLVSTAHRRRGDLAVLKTLGYRPRQLRAVVACQSTAMTVIGLVVGVPLGIALGRWLWVAVAEHLGTLVRTVIPGWQIALMAVAALVVANLAAAWPARMAARTPAAAALHAG